MGLFFLVFLEECFLDLEDMVKKGSYFRGNRYKREERREKAKHRQKRKRKTSPDTQKCY